MTTFDPNPIRKRIARAANHAGMPQASWARWKGGDAAVRAYRKLTTAGDAIDLKLVDEVCTAFEWYPTDFYEEW